MTCRLRGRLKRGPRLGDILAVGDWVKISRQPDGSGMIEEIEERERMFSRMAPTPRGEYQQILIANPDQVVLVFACAEPEPRLRMLDRFLVVAEKAETPTLIVFNKVDLVGIEQARERFGHYDALGYPILFTSVESGMGVSELEEQLVGRVSILAGPSGVGKSSLLNKIQPGLGLSVRDVSTSTRKGTPYHCGSGVIPFKWRRICGGYTWLESVSFVGYRTRRSRRLLPGVARFGGRLPVQQLHTYS